MTELEALEAAVAKIITPATVQSDAAAVKAALLNLRPKVVAADVKAQNWVTRNPAVSVLAGVALVAVVVYLLLFKY